MNMCGHVSYVSSYPVTLPYYCNENFRVSWRTLKTKLTIVFFLKKNFNYLKFHPTWLKKRLLWPQMLLCSQEESRIKPFVFHVVANVGKLSPSCPCWWNNGHILVKLIVEVTAPPAPRIRSLEMWLCVLNIVFSVDRKWPVICSSSLSFPTG